ncbi:MAG: nucleotidyltransferase family protein [Patescibacteria group bacterium]
MIYGKAVSKKIDIVILAGGLGKRLRPISKRLPKPLVKINGKCFLDILIDFWSGFGFRRFILCIGYKGRMIKDYYGTNSKKGFDILFSYEETPLGTGGAVKNAESLVVSDPFIVLNGDSFCKVNPLNLLGFHKKKKALISIVLAGVSDVKDYGEVKINKAQRILSFNEKNGASQEGLINAGIYVFNQEVFERMPNRRKFSLEKDFFPEVAGKNIFGYTDNKLFIDIGTPARYRKAEKIFSTNLKLEV